MLILCKCKNIFWGEKLRGGSAPRSDVVTFACHIGSLVTCPPGFFFYSKISEMDSGAI